LAQGPLPRPVDDPVERPRRGEPVGDHRQGDLAVGEMRVAATGAVLVHDLADPQPAGEGGDQRQRTEQPDEDAALRAVSHTASRESGALWAWLSEKAYGAGIRKIPEP